MKVKNTQYSILIRLIYGVRKKAIANFVLVIVLATGVYGFTRSASNNKSVANEQSFRTRIQSLKSEGKGTSFNTKLYSDTDLTSNWAVVNKIDLILKTMQLVILSLLACRLSSGVLVLGMGM